jgi:hypothetical protein
MLKLLRWIGLTLVLMALIGWIAISYWRSTQSDISSGLFIEVIVLLPLVCVICLYGIVRWIAHSKAKKNQSEVVEDVANPLNDGASIIKADGQWLSVLASCVVTPLGSDLAQITTRLVKKDHNPTSDPVLRFQGMYPYLSQRHKDLPLSNTETQSITDRTYRMQLILEQLYDQLADVLSIIPLKSQTQVPMVHSSGSQQAAVLHPQWLNATERLSVPKTAESKPIRVSLNIVLLLPQHLSVSDKQFLFDDFKVSLKALYQEDDEERAVAHDVMTVASYEDSLKAIEQTLTTHLAHNHIKDPQLLLIIGVDSWIDQQFLDQHYDSQYQILKRAVHPSEGGFALLFADQELSVPEAVPIARLTAPIMVTRSKAISERGVIQAEELRASFEQMYQRNAVKPDQLMSEEQLVFVDQRPDQHNTLSELMQFISPLQLEAQQCLSIGAVLNDTNSMTAGISLAIALTHTAESGQMQAVINNGGEKTRMSFLTASIAQDIENKDSASDAEIQPTTTLDRELA